jgi:hypothetical protein
MRAPQVRQDAAELHAGVEAADRWQGAPRGAGGDSAAWKVPHLGTLQTAARLKEPTRRVLLGSWSFCRCCPLFTPHPHPRFCVRCYPRLTLPPPPAPSPVLRRPHLELLLPHARGRVPWRCRRSGRHLHRHAAVPGRLQPGHRRRHFAAHLEGVCLGACLFQHQAAALRPGHKRAARGRDGGVQDGRGDQAAVRQDEPRQVQHCA